MPSLISLPLTASGPVTAFSTPILIGSRGPCASAPAVSARMGRTASATIVRLCMDAPPDVPGSYLGAPQVDLGDARVRLDRIAGALGEHAAFVHDRHAIGERERHVHVVLDEEHGHLFRKALDHRDDVR